MAAASLLDSLNLAGAPTANPGSSLLGAASGYPYPLTSGLLAAISQAPALQTLLGQPSTGLGASANPYAPSSAQAAEFATPAAYSGPDYNATAAQMAGQSGSGAGSGLYPSTTVPSGGSGSGLYPSVPIPPITPGTGGASSTSSASTGSSGAATAAGVGLGLAELLAKNPTLATTALGPVESLYNSLVGNTIDGVPNDAGALTQAVVDPTDAAAATTAPLTDDAAALTDQLVDPADAAATTAASAAAPVAAEALGDSADALASAADSAISDALGTVAPIAPATSEAAIDAAEGLTPATSDAAAGAASTLAADAPSALTNSALTAGAGLLVTLGDMYGNPSEEASAEAQAAQGAANQAQLTGYQGLLSGADLDNSTVLAALAPSFSTVTNPGLLASIQSAEAADAGAAGSGGGYTVGSGGTLSPAAALAAYQQASNPAYSNPLNAVADLVGRNASGTAGNSVVQNALNQTVQGLTPSDLFTALQSYAQQGVPVGAGGWGLSASDLSQAGLTSAQISALGL